MFENNDYVLSLLVNYGLVSQDQIDDAKSECDWDDSKVVELLYAKDLVTEEDVLNMLAQEYAMSIVELDDYEIPEDVLESIPEEIARQFSVVPVINDGYTITIAMSDPTSLDTLDNLRFILKKDVEAAICTRKSIATALEKYYAPKHSEFEINTDGVSEEDQKALTGDGEDAPIIRLVTMIILDGYKMKASDIHLEPLETRLRVRYRVDGVLKEVNDPPKYLQNNILSRLKIMAGLKITEKRLPQDGRITI
ncbi:MAG: GspE/PulE family protein, partial [Lentisphaeria bacterium]